MLLFCLGYMLSGGTKEAPVTEKQSSASAEASTSSGIANSYMITTRNNTDPSNPNSKSLVVPIPDGGLTWWKASTPADTIAADYSQTNSATAFLQDLAGDLNTAAGTSDTASVTVFIHGLDTDWDDALKTAGYYAGNMANEGYSNGVVVGFSWPAYADAPGLTDPDLSYYATSYPPQNTSGSVRDNINGSCQGFQTMLDSLFNLANHGLTQDVLQVNLVAHSEGGFMVLLGMNYVKANGGFASGDTINQTVLLAPDINYGTLQTPGDSIAASGNEGDGCAITALSHDVTVYYSPHDPDLWTSSSICAATTVIGNPPLQNPIYTVRLGLVGPYDLANVQSNVTGVNCGPMNNNDRMSQLESASVLVYPDTSIHTSYLADPGILSDQVYVLTGTASSFTQGGIRNADKVDPFSTTTNNYCLNPQTYVVSKYNSCSILENEALASTLLALCDITLSDNSKTAASKNKK